MIIRRIALATLVTTASFAAGRPRVALGPQVAQAAATIRSVGDSLVIVSRAPTRVAMRNVDFKVADGIVLRIATLDGEMESKRAGVVDFDDKVSYVLDVDTAEVRLSTADLGNLMNHYIFAYPGAPLSKLSVSQRGSELGLTGIMHKGVDIPFDITSTVSLMPDHRMRLHPTRIKIFSVDGKKLMSALGLSLQKMLDLSKAKGVTVEKNDLLLDPLVVLPPPSIRGRIVAVRVDRDALVQVFGGVRAVALSPPDSAARNFMLYRGGTLHFGKLYMTDADLFIVDGNQTTPFDFDNDHYQKQLIAGHSRTLPSLGLEVVMPDAASLVASRQNADK
ncbi:MAG: hypothetical protein ACJ796_16335 [Gemmatimonadaceae bacterium]